MPDDPKYYAVLTETGAKMEARALAEGRGVLLTHVVVGDADLKDVVPAPTVTALVHEVCRRPIEYRSVDENDANVTLIHALIPANIGGFWVRELGIVGKLESLPGDAAGATPEFLYAYANHAPYYKMLPQAGQLVTHELLIPIVQKTDAKLTIELPDAGYVTRGDYLNPKRAVWNLEASIAANGTLAFPSGTSWLSGQARLELYWLGLKLAKGKDYQELGAAGSSANSVRLLFAASAGDEFQAEIFK